MENELPLYRCHKKVRAAKIVDIHVGTTGASLFLQGIAEPHLVDLRFVARHDPRVGGYLVVYEDGYHSWSPAEAFEKGYTPDEELATEATFYMTTKYDFAAIEKMLAAMNLAIDAWAWKIANEWRVRIPQMYLEWKRRRDEDSRAKAAFTQG